MIIINGVSYEGKSISISGNKVIIDGVEQDQKVSGVVKVEVTGDLASLKTSGSAEITGNVQGNIDAGGHVDCGDVGGNIDAGGSVKCGKVSGSIDAGGSVRCK